MLLSKIHIAGLAVVAVGVLMQVLPAGQSNFGDAGLFVLISGLVIEMVAYAVDDIPGR